jgi:serine/threonine protein kinase
MHCDGACRRHKLSQNASSVGRYQKRKRFRLRVGLQSRWDAAHEKGIVHRDLKPAIHQSDTPDGNVKILDSRLWQRTFSDAAAAIRRICRRCTVTLKKTSLSAPLPYMSPEQARGRTVDTDGPISGHSASCFMKC